MIAIPYFNSFFPIGLFDEDKNKAKNLGHLMKIDCTHV